MLRDPSSYSHEEASADPLWHCRKLLEYFQKNICQVAVPIGTSALDEASVRTKARTTASSYLPSKPDKYATRFYTVVRSRSTYVSSIFDNRAGNKTGESGAEAFCRIYREMRTPFNKTLGKSDIVQRSGSCKWHIKRSYILILQESACSSRITATELQGITY